MKAREELPALQSLMDDTLGGAELPLPEALSAIYGPLRFALPQGRAWVAANFVSSLDGVASLAQPGHAGGGAVSGENPWDLFVMGLLRACADAVIEGAGTQREAPESLLTAQDLCPGFATAFSELRSSLGKPALPLRIVVSGSGGVAAKSPLFQRPGGPVIILTRPAGEAQLAAARMPGEVRVLGLEGEGAMGAREILEALKPWISEGLLLLEGGPHLMGAFMAEERLDELFLTLAPQISGRGAQPRPGIAEGHAFPAEALRWARLLSLKRSVSHLFLRYEFSSLP